MASLEWDNPVVFNSLSTSEIWHYNKGDLYGKGFIRGGLLKYKNILKKKEKLCHDSSTLGLM